MLTLPAEREEPNRFAGYAVSADVIAATLDAEGVEIRANDAVLVRTGYMSVWPDMEVAKHYADSGIDHGAALFLAEHGAVLVGSDTEGMEVAPSGVPGNPSPVHIELLIKQGIFIVELMNLEELAADRVYEFCFVCLPLRVRGADRVDGTSGGDLLVTPPLSLPGGPRVTLPRIFTDYQELAGQVE